MIPPEAQRPAFPLRSCTEEESSHGSGNGYRCGAWVPQAAIQHGNFSEGLKMGRNTRAKQQNMT